MTGSHRNWLAATALAALIAGAGAARAQTSSAAPPAAAQPAAAQPAPPTGDAPPPEPVEAAFASQPTSAAERQVYTPADFARYAPRNAYDMLNRVPGFTIRESEQRRGLGQATGNVLFNGQRSSSKSDDLATQLARIPADNVVRIEIVDGATLDLPGLSGQVANIIYRASNFSGQFAWRPEFRTHFTDPLLSRGNVSVSGRTGKLQYELGLDNGDSGRGGAGGETLVLNGGGLVIDRWNDVFTSLYDSPKLSAKLSWDGPGSSVGHLNGQYQRIFSRYREAGLRQGVGQPDRNRIVHENGDSWNREIGGDFEFRLGPGRLKLIGLSRFSHEPYEQLVVTRFADGSPAAGDRFRQTGDLAEQIARGEYSWKLWGGDWQLSGEAAYNSLDNVASLASLDAAGRFVELPFPGGTGGVAEDRYETLLSFGHPLTRTLSLQLVAGAEQSTIAQTGPKGLTRSFFRPKGSLALAWKPSADFDLSAKLRRRVLQLSFYDFLARAFLNDNNQNAGNADLRPQQDWSVEIEANRKLGAWGSTKLLLIYRDVEDYVDIVPVPGGEAVGNVPRSWAGAIRSTSTIQFDPLGLRGVRMELDILFQKSGLRDPFTGETRSWSGFTDRNFSLSLRHDIPHSNWAYGGDVSYSHRQPFYRSNQVDWVYEGPSFASLFIENKDVLGLTVRGEVVNFNNARSRRERTVYAGLRGATPIAFVEARDRLIGPIFAFSVKGSF